MKLEQPTRADFPNLPYLYSKSGKQTSRPRYQADGVNNFFENLIGHVNRPKAHEGSLPVLRRDKEKDVYDPNAPLITTDIYVSKPPKFKSSVQTDVERVKEHLSRISTLYKEVIVYKKPRIMPLIPLPEFRHQKKKEKKAIINDEGEEQDVDEISDDALLPWDFSNGLAYKQKNKRGSVRKLSRKSVKTSVKNKVKPVKVKAKAAPIDKNLDNAWKELRNATKYIMFCNWLFRYYRYQINKCYTRVNDYLKEKYPICMQEISRDSFSIIKPQMIKTWLSIFSESSINIIIDKQLLYTYNLMEEEELKTPYTKSEKEEYIKSYQPFANEVHVDLNSLETRS